jgi:hypothetical protein
MMVTGGVIPSGTGVTLMRRVTGNNGLPITKASLTSIAWTLTDITNGMALGTGTFAISAVVFDVLQTADPRWAFDTVGYNFAATIPAAQTLPVASPSIQPAAGKPMRQLQCDVLFTPVTGEPFRSQFTWPAAQVYG